MNLAVKMAELPEPPNNSKPPLWNYWRHQLWQLAQSDEPRHFMRWPPIFHCMLVDHWPSQMQIEFDYVVRNGVDVQALAGASLPAINIYHAQSSQRNLIHQAYHILRWQEATGLNIADMQSIYEFGGGYGAMALVCNRLGFKGKYYIYDLPEFALLQQWYLEECGVDNVAWVNKGSENHVDLFIACYSLSETGFTERDKVLDDWLANSYLFLYSNKFEQFDNIAYFQNMDDEWPIQHWQHSHIDHLPPESWYTWGW